MTAESRFPRIVSLVASLTRLEADGGHTTLGELALAHDVTAGDIAGDIRSLTSVGNHSDADWVSSLTVWQQDDRVAISSQGPFRRPVQLSPEERLAIQVALALDPSGAGLARRFASLWAGRSAGPPSTTAPDTPDEPLALLLSATNESREIRVSYTAEGERAATEWLLEPHQVVQSHGRTYVAAWTVEGWRHFRLDRILSASMTGRSFERRQDFVPLENPDDVFRPGLEMDKVTVRFSAAVAPSVIERYPEHHVQPDGRVQVIFTTSSPEWMARKVLEYGRDAEVVEPARYRRAVMQAVA